MENYFIPPFLSMSTMDSDLRTELHPESKALLEENARKGSPRSHQLAPEGARQVVTKGLEEVGALDNPTPVTNITQYHIQGPDTTVPVRVYTPAQEGEFPVLVWFHGGGWVRGDLDFADPICRYLTRHVGCTTVSVGYRLAPENPFPAGLKDCYAAVEWVWDHPEIVLGDHDRIAVGGTSAGGNLAAAVSLRARENDFPTVAYQFLGVPVTNYGFQTDSYEENATGYGLCRPDMKYYWNHYLSDKLHGQNPYASPLKARSLKDLPPAMVVTCGFDPLRDEGAYAERLKDAGVSVTHNHYPDVPHSLLGYGYVAREVEPTMEALSDITTELRRAFNL